MMNLELDRRTFLKRSCQAGGLVVAGGTLEAILAACGGNVSTTTGSSTAAPGATTVASAGLKSPGNLQWGADYVSGAPYVFKDPTNPNNLVGFEVEIAVAMAALMGGIQQTQVEVCYSNLEQALRANQIDMVMNGWEKTPDRLKTELFSDPYYRYGQQVIVRKDDTRFANVVPQTVADLEGYTVGTGSGYKAETLMLADKKINVKSYTGNIAFTDLVQKKVDAFFLDFPIATYYVNGTGPGATPIPQLKFLGMPIYIDDYFVGFNKSNANAAKLLPEINQCISILKKNGTLKKIYTKWQLQNPLQAQIGVM
jgi:polar amino acid transport system substrate-binding protein